MTEIVIPARFNGPARSGNGGFVAGSLAEVVLEHGDRAVHRVVEVTLRRPPPLDTALTVTTEDGVTTLGDEAGPVATARVVDDDLEAVDEVPADRVSATLSK